jgi:hypothetical protein
MRRLLKKAESLEFLKQESLLALNEMKLKTEMPMIKDIIVEITDLPIWTGKKIENPDEKTCWQVIDKAIQFVKNSTENDRIVMHSLYDSVYMFAE